MNEDMCECGHPLSGHEYRGRCKRETYSWVTHYHVRCSCPRFRMKRQKKDSTKKIAIATDALFWDEKGHIACEKHAPPRGSDTWRRDRWKKIPASASTGLFCESCSSKPAAPIASPYTPPEPLAKGSVEQAEWSINDHGLIIVHPAVEVPGVRGYVFSRENAPAVIAALQAAIAERLEMP